MGMQDRDYMAERFWHRIGVRTQSTPHGKTGGAAPRSGHQPDGDRSGFNDPQFWNQLRDVKGKKSSNVTPIGVRTSGGRAQAQQSASYTSPSWNVARNVATFVGLIALVYLLIATLADSTKPTQPPTPTGQVYWSSANAHRTPARLTRTAPARIPRESYVFSSHNWDTNCLVASIPMRAGLTAVTGFPLARNRMRIAKGTS